MNTVCCAPCLPESPPHRALSRSRQVFYLKYMKYKYPRATNSLGFIGRYSLTKEVPLRERPGDSSGDRGKGMGLGARQSRFPLSLGSFLSRASESPPCSVSSPEAKVWDRPPHTAGGVKRGDVCVRLARAGTEETLTKEVVGTSIWGHRCAIPCPHATVGRVPP